MSLELILKENADLNKLVGEKSISLYKIYIQEADGEEIREIESENSNTIKSLIPACPGKMYFRIKGSMTIKEKRYDFLLEPDRTHIRIYFGGHADEIIGEMLKDIIRKDSYNGHETQQP